LLKEKGGEREEGERGGIGLIDWEGVVLTGERGEAGE